MGCHHPEPQLPFLGRRTKACFRIPASLKGSDFPVADFLGWFPYWLCLGQYHLPAVFSRKDVFPSHSAGSL